LGNVYYLGSAQGQSEGGVEAKPERLDKRAVWAWRKEVGEEKAGVRKWKA